MRKASKGFFGASGILRGFSPRIQKPKCLLRFGVLDMGVSKNRGVSPKMDGLYNGKPYSKWMIWGYTTFSETPICFGRPNNEPQQVVFGCLGRRYSWTTQKSYRKKKKNKHRSPQEVYLPGWFWMLDVSGLDRHPTVHTQTEALRPTLRLKKKKLQKWCHFEDPKTPTASHTGSKFKPFWLEGPWGFLDSAWSSGNLRLDVNCLRQEFVAKEKNMWIASARHGIDT